MPDVSRRLPLILALGLMAAGCGRAVPEHMDGTAARPHSVAVHTPERPAPHVSVPMFQYTERTATPDPEWLAAAREDPDPNVRLHALDTWAQNPGETLDPVTYSLVDPDESIRARAQALLEHELTRR